MIYVASPYTHEDPATMDHRYNDIAARCAGWAQQGWPVYSPIAHWHPIAKKWELPRDHKYWLFHNSEMIQLCREMWVVTTPGWKESEGMEADRKLARVYHKKVKVIHVP